MDPEYKRARSQYTSAYASMWAGKWAQTNPTIKQEKAANLMSENTNQSQNNSSPIPTPVNNSSPYPTSFPESLAFSNYDSSNNMTQTYSSISSNTGTYAKTNFTYWTIFHNQFQFRFTHDPEPANQLRLLRRPPIRSVCKLLRSELRLRGSCFGGSAFKMIAFGLSPNYRQD